MSKRTIYTSLDNYKSNKAKVKSLFDLDEYFVEWVNEKSVKLLIERRKSELLAGEELKRLTSEVHEQVFFKIADRSYFLDYFLPRYNIAIEIDGGYHKSRRKEDNIRDKDFLSIGIRTIRITSGEVLKGKFIEVLKSKLIKNKKTI